jgi:uncharacterized protein (DUF1501 family)
VDMMKDPGAGIGRDIATEDKADAQIDAFISKRDAKRREKEGARAAEELWEASSRVHDARRAAAMRAERWEYHRAQAERHRRNLGALVAHHEAEAERLMQATGRRTA